jgi:hypothetical protein
LCHVLVASLIYCSNKLAPLTTFGRLLKTDFPRISMFGMLDIQQFQSIQYANIIHILKYI